MVGKTNNLNTSVKINRQKIKERLEQLDKESKRILFQNLENKRRKEQNLNRETISNIKNNVKAKSTKTISDKTSNDSICSNTSCSLISSPNNSNYSWKSESNLSNTDSMDLSNSESSIKLLILKSFVTKTRLKYLYWIKQHVQTNYKRHRLPYGLKPTAPKRYPYNFISAVRRKLKTFLKFNMNEEFSEDKDFLQNIPETKTTTRCNLNEKTELNTHTINKRSPRDSLEAHEMLISQNTMLSQGSEDETTVSSSIFNGNCSWQQSSHHKSDQQPNAALLHRKIELSLAKMETQASLAKLLFDFNQRLQNAIEINQKLKCKTPREDQGSRINHCRYNNAAGSSNNTNKGKTEYIEDSIRRKDSMRTNGTLLSNQIISHKFSIDKNSKLSTSKYNNDLYRIESMSNLRSTPTISTKTNKSTKCDNFESITQSGYDLSKKLTNSEISKADQFKLLLKIREKLLVDRAKSKIAWLELQKERLKGKGLKMQVSAAKKKQRSILLKMEKDLKQMKKLFKYKEQSSETSSMQSQMESQSRFSNRNSVKDNKQIPSDIYLNPLKLSDITDELSLQNLSTHLPMPLKFQEFKKKPKMMHHRILRLLKYIEKSLTFLAEDENCNCVEYIYTTGAKLNKLWERLTLQNVEQFESNKWYKLCRNDFKNIYEEAKARLSYAFTANQTLNRNSKIQSIQSGGRINLNVLRQVNTGTKTKTFKLSELKLTIIESKENINDINWSSIKMLLLRIQEDQTFLYEMTEYVAASISFNTLHAETILNLKYLRYIAKEFKDMCIRNTPNSPTDRETVDHTKDLKISNENELEKFNLINNIVNKVYVESQPSKLFEPNLKCKENGTDQPIIHKIVKSLDQEKYLLYTQTEKIQENNSTIPSLYIREIPNKPPPPYVPPAPGSPMTTIFPSEERIRCLTYRRSHELFCRLSNTDYVNEKGDPLPSVLNEKITNIYERIVLEICQEWYDEHKDILNQRDPCNFHNSLALYNPPNRLRSIQNSIYKDVRYALTMEKKSFNQSQPHLIYGNRSKRDHIEKIIIQELFDEDKQWDSFLCNENEVLKLIIDGMIEQHVEEIVEESWTEAQVQLQ